MNIKKIFKKDYIRLWWDHEGRYLHKDIYNGVKNFVSYAKVIWEDRNWDHQYTEDILLVKYKLWYKNYQKVGLRYEGEEKHLQVLRILISILERRKNEWYTDVWHSKYAYKQKYWCEPLIDSENFEFKSKGLTPEEEVKSTEWLEKVRQCEIRDWKIFCKILEKYHSSMWS